MGNINRGRALVVNSYLYLTITFIATVTTWVTENDTAAYVAMTCCVLSLVTLGVATKFTSTERDLGLLWIYIGFILIAPGTLLSTIFGWLNDIFNLYTDVDLDDQYYYEGEEYDE